MEITIIFGRYYDIDLDALKEVYDETGMEDDYGKTFEQLTDKELKDYLNDFSENELDNICKINNNISDYDKKIIINRG